jgi:hypothetical protein
LLRGFDGGVSVERLAQQLQRGVHAVEVRLCKLGRLSGNLAGAVRNQTPQPTGPASPAP